VREQKRVHWHYFDKARRDVAGSAEIRLENDDARLVAELRHMRREHADDEGNVHALFTETFTLKASRNADGLYDVDIISFDDQHYTQAQDHVVELGLGIFHARALDISI